MTLLLSLILGLSAQAAEKSILPTSFYFEPAADQGDVTIGGNTIYDLVLNYNYMPCNGQKFKAATAVRDSNSSGNTVYWVNLKIEIPPAGTTMYCPTEAVARIKNVNKALLDVNTVLYFQADP